MPIADIQRQKNELATKRRTIVDALKQADEALELETRRARKAIGEHMASDWEQVCQRQADAALELARAIDQYSELQDQMGGSAELCGLPNRALNGVLGPKLRAALARQVNDGLIRRDSVPQGWL